MTYTQPEWEEYTMESYPDVLTASLGTGDGGSEDDGPW